MRKKIVFCIKLWKDLNIKEKLLVLLGIIFGLFFLVLPMWFFWENNFEKLPSEGGVLKEGLYQPITTLNPFLTTNSSEKALINLLFDKVIVDNGNGGFSYELGKNITELDRGLKFLVELKDNKLWSNKEKINSDDLIFSFETLKKYGSDDIKNLFRDIEVERVDNFQVFFTSKIRDNFFYNKLNQVYVVPKSVWQKFSQSDWKAQEEYLLAVISGPFMIEKRNDEEIVFSENKLYNPKPYIKKIVFKIYPDLQSTVEGLRTRGVDSIGGIPSNILKSITSRRFKISRTISPRVVGIFLNSKETAGINADGLLSVEDKERIIKEIFDGEAEISNGIFSKSIREILNIPQIDLTAEKSRNQTTKQPDNQIDIVVPQNYFFQKIANFISEKIPLKIRVETTENIYSDILQNKNYQAIILGINYNMPPNLGPFFFENTSFNLINKSTQDLTNLLQKLSIEQLNSENYRETLIDTEKEILNTGKIVFIANPYYLYVLPKNLKGYNLRILRQPEERFDKIELWHLNLKTKLY